MKDTKPEPNIDKIKRANYANCLKKIQAGKTLSAAEMQVVTAYEESKAVDEISKTRAYAKNYKGIRWTTQLAATEFGKDVRTLAKLMSANSVAPGADGLYSTHDICSAVFGDIKVENLGKVRAERQILELKIGEMERTLIPAKLVEKAWEFIAVAIRQTIVHAERMPQSAKDSVLSELVNIPIDEYFKDAARFVEAGDDGDEKPVPKAISGKGVGVGGVASKDG